MGRDDAKPIPGLAGGRAPAEAFRAFMIKAVAKRPVEQFETEVTLPDWQLEPDEEAYYSNSAQQPIVDENGLPIDPGASDDYLRQQPDRAPPPAEGGERLDQQWIDGVLGRDNRAATGNRPNP
jgi:penicillin-binding protein 1A